MAQTVAHGFFCNLKQLSGLHGSQVARSRGIDFNLKLSGSGPTGQRERLERRFEFTSVQHLRFETGDKAAHAPDGIVQGRNRRNKARLSLLRELTDYSSTVLEVQANCVDGLNDIIVEVA